MPELKSIMSGGENLNTKDYGYFGTHEGGYQIGHFSYTFRFGNHSELPLDELTI